MDIDKVSTLIADNVFDRLEMENLHGAKVVSKSWVKEEAANVIAEALKAAALSKQASVAEAIEDVLKRPPFGDMVRLAEYSVPVSLEDQVKAIEQLCAKPSRVRIFKA